MSLHFIQKKETKQVIVNHTLGELNIVEGISQRCIKQLIEYSQPSHGDTTIQNFTSDARRFKNIDTLKEWYYSGNMPRDIYSLINKNGILQGVIWFAPDKPLLSFENYYFNKNINKNNYRLSWVVRLYGRARHQKLAKTFINKVVKLYVDTQNYRKLKAYNCHGLWHGLSVPNESAMHLMSELGFYWATGINAEGRVRMVQQKLGLEQLIQATAQ